MVLVIKFIATTLHTFAQTYNYGRNYVFFSLGLVCMCVALYDILMATAAEEQTIQWSIERGQWTNNTMVNIKRTMDKQRFSKHAHINLFQMNPQSIDLG